MLFQSLTKGSCALAAGIVGAALLTPTPVQAQQDVPVFGDNVEFELGADVTTDYYFRGFKQEDDGLILQPWANVGFTVFEDPNGPIDSAEVFLETWNSLHSEQTGSMGRGPSIWYESDFVGGINVGVMEDWELGLAYTAYTSPNGAFETIQEISVGASFDDSRYWEQGFSLDPHALLAFEVSHPGENNGTYLELGVAPGMTFNPGTDYPVEFAVPVTLGLGLDNYYIDPETGSDRTYGYTNIGVEASVPMAFIPSEYGDWYASAGAHMLWQGRALKRINDDSRRELIGVLGVNMVY